MKLIKISCLLVLLLLCSFRLSAQSKITEENNTQSSWYVGLKGGVPFGFSTFSSFGANRTHLGYDAGIFGGYNINSFLSAEFSASLSNIGMSAHPNVTYWLGSDGNHYFSPVNGMVGYDYSKLYSTVSMQNYGLQLNIDLLQLFLKKKNNPWMLQASPSFSAVLSKSTIKKMNNNAVFLEGDNVFNFGIGGDISVGYRVTPNLNIHIYSGATYLAGDRFDGIPEHLHANNYVWNSGIKVSWSFGKKKSVSVSNHYAPINTTSPIYSAPPTPKNKDVVKKIKSKKSDDDELDSLVSISSILPIYPAQEKDNIVSEKEIPIVDNTKLTIDSTLVDNTKSTIDSTLVDNDVVSPILFYSNQTFIPNTEFDKLEELLDIMNASRTNIIYKLQ